MEKTKNQNTSLISGAISLTISVIIVKLIGFFYKLPLSYILEDEGMGYFNSAYTVFSFFYLICSSGIPRSISILVTEKTVKKDYLGRRNILISSLILFLSLGSILTILMFAFSYNISLIIGNSGAYYSLLCISPTLVIVTVAGVFRGYLNGISDIIPISISQVLEVIIKFIFGLIFALVGAKYRFDLSVISALTVLGVTIGSLISTLYLMICVKNRISVNNAEQKVKITFNKDVIKRIVIIALPLTFSSAIMGISNIFDLGLIMQRLVSIGYTEVEANSLYGNYTTLVIPLLNLVIALISPISVAALPMIAGAHYLNDKDLLIENSKTLIEFTAFISIPIAFGFFAFSKEILLLLFKDNSALIAAPLLMLLVPSMIFLPLLTISNTILEANEQIHLPLISMSVAAIVKFFVSFYLIGDSEFGISGAPLGTSISYGIGFLVSLILLLRKTNIRLHVFSALYKPVLISFISVFGAKLLYIWMLRGINSMLSFIISVFLSVIIYLIISYFMGAFSFKKIKKLSKLPKIV